MRHEGLELAWVHGLLSWSSWEREHARKLCLLCGDILVALRFDIPLCQASSSFENWNNVCQIWCRLLLLGRWGCALLSLSSGTSAKPSIAFSSVASSSSTASTVIEQVSVSSRWSFIVVSSCIASRGASISVPLPLTTTTSIPARVSIFALPFSIIAARRISVYLAIATRWAGASMSRRTRTASVSIPSITTSIIA